MDAATYKRLRQLGCSDRQIREFYVLGDISDEGGDQLETWAQQEALMRHRKPLAELSVEQRETVYQMVSRESGYLGANTVKRLMGAEGDGYGTVGVGHPTSMPLRPAWESNNDDESMRLQRAAEQLAADRGEDLSELSHSNPALCASLYARAARQVAYRGPFASAFYGDSEAERGDE